MIEPDFGYKRYILFAGEAYYPAGGWDDYIASFETLEEAKAAEKEKMKGYQYDWSHVVDLHTGRIVE